MCVSIVGVADSFLRRMRPILVFASVSTSGWFYANFYLCHVRSKVTSNLYAVNRSEPHQIRSVCTTQNSSMIYIQTSLDSWCHARTLHLAQLGTMTQRRNPLTKRIPSKVRIETNSRVTNGRRPLSRRRHSVKRRLRWGSRVAGPRVAIAPRKSPFHPPRMNAETANWNFLRSEWDSTSGGNMVLNKWGLRLKVQVTLTRGHGHICAVSARGILGRYSRIVYGQTRLQHYWKNCKIEILESAREVNVYVTIYSSHVIRDDQRLIRWSEIVTENKGRF